MMNGYLGVYVSASAGTGNRINGNRIFGHLLQGIELGDDGNDTNDAGDPDGGPNRRQNYPQIAAAFAGGNILYSFNSTPSRTFRLEFFASPTCNNFGHGEGETYLGSTNVTTDGSGNTAVTMVSFGTLTLGNVITATATDLTGL